MTLGKLCQLPVHLSTRLAVEVGWFQQCSCVLGVVGFEAGKMLPTVDSWPGEGYSYVAARFVISAVLCRNSQRLLLVSRECYLACRHGYGVDGNIIHGANQCCCGSF
jgi:hypothetical protein